MFAVLKVMVAVLAVVYAVANVFCWGAVALFAVFGKDDPRFEGDKLIYRS